MGQRRARLKAMAYKGTKNKQAYKHRKLVTESTDDSEEDAVAKKKTKNKSKPEF